MATAEKTDQFASTAGIVFSCLGTVVGTGNVWRFPRILAQNSAAGGTLVFLFVWLLFLFIWSSPMLLIEYAIGRYYKKSPIQAFHRAMGDKFMWCGAWVTAVTFFISTYYSVIVGWCIYYLGDTLRRSFFAELPLSEEESRAVFNDLTGSALPLVFHGCTILLAGACVIGGIKSIEKVNMVLVPTLLVIVVFNFCWSAVQHFSDYGIRFLFSPDWESLSNPRMWVDAATQNAFDTGAAMGLIVPYATYMSARNGVVRFSTLIPAGNNFVSLICGITVFSTVFTTLVTRYPTLSLTGILEIIKTTGPASTGLTFVWIPILFGSLGAFGKVLCCLFFLCLSFAGLSTVIADVEHTSLTLCDFGMPRRLATPICGLLMFALGAPSALNIEILDNQDFIWGFGLLVSGLMFQGLVLRVGYTTFKETLVNKYGKNDWPLTHFTMILIVAVAPLEAVVLLGWWFYEEISETGGNEPGKRWFDLGLETLMTVLLAWVLLISLLLGANFLLLRWRPSWMDYHGSKVAPAPSEELEEGHGLELGNDSVQKSNDAVEESNETAQEPNGEAQESIDAVQESNEPVQESTDPVYVSTNPVYVSTEPVQERTEPVQESTEPVQESTEPVQESNEPVQESNEPVQESNEPVQESTEPVQESNEPVQESNEPVQESNEPVQESNEPVQESNEPVQESNEPVQESNEPVQESNEPVQESNEPVQESRGGEEEEKGEEAGKENMDGEALETEAGRGERNPAFEF